MAKQKKEVIHAVIITEKGMVIKFKLDEVPEIKRGSVGVRGVRVKPDDKIVALSVYQTLE